MQQDLTFQSLTVTYFEGLLFAIIQKVSEKQKMKNMQKSSMQNESIFSHFKHWKMISNNR